MPNPRITAVVVFVACSLACGRTPGNSANVAPDALGPVQPVAGTKDDTKPDYPSILSSLAEQRAQWQVKRPRAYDFQITRSAFAYTPPLYIQVRGETVVWAGAADNGKALPLRGDLLDRLGTVDRLFSVIERACEARYDRVDVVYDGELGYPTNIYLVSDDSVSESDERIQVARLRRIR